MGVSISNDLQWAKRFPGVGLVVKLPLIAQPSWSTCIKSVPEPPQHEAEIDWDWIVGAGIGGLIAFLVPILWTSLWPSSPQEQGPPSSIVHLNAEKFWSVVGQQRNALVLFFNGTCAECQDFLWDFETLNERVAGRKDLVVAKVEHTLREPALGKHFKTTYRAGPTILWFDRGSAAPVLYSGNLGMRYERVDQIEQWIKSRSSLGSSNNNQPVHEAECVISTIYEWYDGYDAPEAEQRAADRLVRPRSWLWSNRLFHSHDASVYGEVLPQGIATYIEAIDVEPGDVFYDLGCGTAKVVIQAALSSKFGRSVGIELLKSRFNHGQRALDSARCLLRDPRRRKRREYCCDVALLEKLVAKVDSEDALELRLGDISVASYTDASHIFCASTTWPRELVSQICRNIVDTCLEARTFATLQEPDEDLLEELSPVMEFNKRVMVDVSWQDRAPLYIYVINRDSEEAEEAAAEEVATKEEAACSKS